MEWDVSEWQCQTTLEMTLRDVHPISSLLIVNQLDRTEKRKEKQTNKHQCRAIPLRTGSTGFAKVDL